MGSQPKEWAERVLEDIDRYVIDGEYQDVQEVNNLLEEAGGVIRMLQKEKSELELELETCENFLKVR